MKVFITGGTTGIGLALARHYLGQGWQVGVCGRDLSKLTDEYLLCNGNFQAYEVDVLNKEKLLESINEFAQGELDLVIANAGRSVGAKSTIPNFESSKEVIEINVLGVLYTFEAAFKLMQPKNKGHMAAVASVAGFVGLPGAGPYSASKAAVLKLCESYSLDFRRFGIDVTAIAPGFIDTPLTQKNNHSMPFMMSSEKAAEIIYNDLMKKKPLIIFPLPMRVVITLLYYLPRSLYRKVMTLKLFNYSSSQ